MSKDIVWFAENIYKQKLNEQQKEILLEIQNTKNNGREIFINLGRTQGKRLIANIVYNFEIWLKDQQIAELKKALEMACKNRGCELCKYKYYQECPPNHTCKDGVMEYFLDKAKEMLKDDNRRN